MSERRRLIVLALLTGLHAAAAVFVAPVDFLEPESYSGYAKFVVVGFFLVPPALLAFIAVFGPWPIAVRLPLTSWLVCVLALLLTYGVWRGDCGDALSGPRGEGAWFGGLLVEYLFLMAPLALLRAVRCWRLEMPYDHAGGESETTLPSPGPASSQYTIRAAFGWTLAAATVFAAIRWLFNEQGLAEDDWGRVLIGSMIEGIKPGVGFSLAALPAYSAAWLLLVSGRKLVLRLTLIVVTAGGIAAMLAWFWETDHDIRSLLATGAFEAGLIAAALASLAVFRACGYRLVRRPRGAETAPEFPKPSTSRNKRLFAWTRASLALATIALVCCVPGRLAVWHRAAETRRWAKLGLEVGCDDEGRLVCIQGDATRLTDVELRRFAELPDLFSLDFDRLRDSQLAVLVAPAGLESLRIADLRFTDQGLEHVARFPQLKRLDLSGTGITNAGLGQVAALKQLTDLGLSLTDVSDDGLAALAECKKLLVVDLYLTSVTEAGATRLSAALPATTIAIGACDAFFSPATLRRSHAAIRRQRLHAAGKYQVFGPQRLPIPPGSLTVTDAGLRLLNADMELIDLDLRESAVTDAGLAALFGLKTLKRIDLRDTAVTEAGRQRLASALPGCEILR